MFVIFPFHPTESVEASPGADFKDTCKRTLKKHSGFEGKEGRKEESLLSVNYHSSFGIFSVSCWQISWKFCPQCLNCGGLYPSHNF